MWEKVKLGEIFNIARGGSPRPIQDFLTDDDSGINWIMIGDTSNDKYITSTKNRIKPEGLKKSRFVHSGDFLLTNSMSFGRPYILKIDGCIHDGWLVLSPKKVKSLSTDFFYHLLGSNVIKKDLEKMASGAVVKNLNSDIVKNFETPLPPLPIQEKIAEILDKADELRRKDQELQDKYDQLAQAIFIDIFGDPVKNEKGWEVKKLEAVCTKITDGTHHSPANILAGKKYITAKHIKNGKLDFYKNETYVSEEDHTNIYSRCNPEFGDVLYIKDGATTGMAAVNDLHEEFSMLSSLALFKLKRELLNNNYLVYFLNSEIVKSNLIREFMAGAAIKRFTLQKIKKFNIILPPIHLQEEFAKKIEIINQLKAQTNTQKSEELFQSLLQKAFKGELVS